MSGAEWATLISGLGGAGISAYAASRNANKNREIAADELDQDESQDVRDVALRESALDPFRHQRSQLQNLHGLDMLRQFGSGGRRVTPPANVAPFTGQVRQGYKPSPGMLQSIDALEQSIRGGNTAPTMTDPANFGRTSAVNINAANGQPGGVGVSGAGAAPRQRRDPWSYLPGQEYRRNEGAGGAWSGAGKGAVTGATFGGPAAVPAAIAGAVIGGVAGAFTKNAKTAMTDLSLEQAQQVLDQVYQEELGRHASPQEIQSQLEGQGWKPGHRWVGEQGMLALISSIQNSIEARQRGAVAA